MNIRKRIIAANLVLIISILMFAINCYADPQALPQSQNIQSNYAIHLFSQDVVLKNPTSSATSYFQLYPGMTVANPVVLDLWYSYSPTIRPDISTMAISVNGVPVASRILEIQVQPAVNWQVSLPAHHFQVGYNEIRVSATHRTIDGLCRDIDNDANWFIVRPETRLRFGVTQGAHTLADYPDQFIDKYLAPKINTAVYLPTISEPELLSALLTMATDWGVKAPAGQPQRLEVRLGQPEQTLGDQVVFTLAKTDPSNVVAPNSSMLTLSELSNGFNRLTINGYNSSSIAKAVDILGRQQYIKTVSGNQLVLDDSLVLDNMQPASNKTHGKYTLSDLGYTDDVQVAGAFHQSAWVTVPRPPNFKAGDGSYIELHFRHSKVLDPKKSAVTIYINDIPIRAETLTIENSERGILRAPIPVSQLNKPNWLVRFGFYHDLGIVDCSKRYDEVAWSVVEKSTYVYLAPGTHERYPNLADFPNNFYVNSKGTINITMMLPEQLTIADVNAAFKLAYFIGQQKQMNITWQVVSPSSFSLKNSKENIIVLGSNGDIEFWELLKNNLAIYPQNDGKFHIAPWLEVLSTGLNQFDIYQLSRIDEQQMLYAFMYTDPNRMMKLLDLALVQGSPLSGQVALVDAQGHNIVYQQPESITSNSSFSWFDELISGNIGVGSIYLLVFAAVLVTTLIMLYVMRNRP